MFFINYERNFNLFNYKKSLMLTNATKSRIKMLKKIHENIIKMQNKSSTYVNNKRKNEFLLKKKIKYIFLQKILREKTKAKN